MSGGAGRRLAYAVSAEREVAWFRLGSALVVLPSSLAVLACARPIGAKALAVLGLLVSIAWVVAFSRSRARLREAHAKHLDIGPEGLTIALGAAPIQVRWSEVESVEIDEERLVVEVKLVGGDAVDVPPVWEGVGLAELCALIEGTRDGALRPPHR